MKYIFAIIGSVVITVTLVAFFFNLSQVNQERATLTINLEQRATLLADSLKESVEPLYINSSQDSLQASLQKTVNKFANREMLAGIALYDNKGTLLATSSGLPKTIIFSITIFIILRFFVFRQVIRLVDSIKKIRMGGKNATFKDTDKYSFFTPLAKEIAHM